MKIAINRLALVFLLVLIQDCLAQPLVHFDESGYQSVMARSKAEQLPVFYMIHASWCPHCKKMKEEVFTNPVVADFLNTHFICAWQDIDEGEGEMLKHKFNIRNFPTFLFLDENGTVLYNINGEYKSDALIAEAKNALIPEKQLPFLKKQFLDDPANADKCLAYLTTLKKGSDRKELSPAAHQYLATQTEQQLVSETNWKIIANAVTDIQSREFQYVLKHQPEFAGVASQVRVQRKIGNIVSELLKPYVDNLDTINYYKKRAIAKTVNVFKADSLVFTFDTMIAERTKNWNAYKTATIGSVEKYIWTDQKAIKEIAQVYLDHFADVKTLEHPISWTRHALELTDSYDGNLLLAKLYLKINDRKHAIIFASNAKELTRSMGWNSAEGEKLFAELGIK